MSKTGLSVASMNASEKAKLNGMLDAAQASTGGFVQLVSIGPHAATAVSGALCPTFFW